ncbi:MAG: Crp/Fnr family transcriptional regulator [Elainellaceae cyanobacterium]
MTSKNRLLDAMSDVLLEKLSPHMIQVSLPQGELLHSPGDSIKDVYFPLDCLLSITITMQDGSTVETGVVGNRDMLGVNAFMGTKETTQTEYVVQIPGSAIKVKALPLREEFDQNKELRDILLEYTQALIAQLSQTTACNRLHVLEQRLARWLLEAQIRVESDELMLTQGFIAEMLGVRRAGVTQAAQKLQESGLIQYTRGRVQILDRGGLEAASCECFEAIQNEYNRLLGRKK